MPSKRHPLHLAAIVEDIAREVNFEVRVTPHESFAVHMGPPTVPKGSSTETSPLVISERPAVRLDDDYLIAVFPSGYKAFRRLSDGRWTRQPEGWARATERSLVKITVNVFHAMMWRRLKNVRARLGALDEIPWEEGSTAGSSRIVIAAPEHEAWIVAGLETVAAHETQEEAGGNPTTEGVPCVPKEDEPPIFPAAHKPRKEFSGHTPPEVVPRASGEDDLPMSPAAKPLRRRLARIKKS